MKIFPWLLSFAFSVVCLTCWAMSTFALQSLDANRPLPAITDFVIRPNGWILICPIPWLIYAFVLSLRREPTPGSIFIFAGTLFSGRTILVVLIIIASVMPFIVLKTFL